MPPHVIKWESPVLSRNLNRAHQGSARCEIGQLPVAYYDEPTLPEESINASITAFISTGGELTYEIMSHYKAITQISVTEDNNYNSNLLTINMLCDSRLYNYHSLRRYWLTIQSGQTNGFPILDTSHRIYGMDGHYRNRLSFIPYINVNIADDNMQKVETISYQRCRLKQLSELQHNFLEPSVMSFTASFIYEFIDINRSKEPMQNSTPECIVNG